LERPALAALLAVQYAEGDRSFPGTIWKSSGCLNVPVSFAVGLLLQVEAARNGHCSPSASYIFLQPMRSTRDAHYLQLLFAKVAVHFVLLVLVTIASLPSFLLPSL
jgi:hypothetical protein